MKPRDYKCLAPVILKIWLLFSSCNFGVKQFWCYLSTRNSKILTMVLYGNQNVRNWWWYTKDSHQYFIKNGHFKRAQTLQKENSLLNIWNPRKILKFLTHFLNKTSYHPNFYLLPHLVRQFLSLLRYSILEIRIRDMEAEWRLNGGWKS